MTARDVLDQITDRAEAWVTVDMHSDVIALVGVVRVVLDYADKIAESIRGAITEALRGRA